MGQIAKTGGLGVWIQKLAFGATYRLNMSRARLAEAMPEGSADVLGRCQNRLCSDPIPPVESGWRKTDRRFCCDQCKQEASLIRRAAKLLDGLPASKVLGILRQ
jgi:hypothetical protein